MLTRTNLAALLLATLLAPAVVRGESLAQRNLWPQATAAVDTTDYAAADQRIQELLEAGKAIGIRRYPLYAQSAIGLARQAQAEGDAARVEWGLKAAARLDPASPNVAYNIADLQRRRGNWPGAFSALVDGFTNVASDYKSRTIAQSDLTVAFCTALAALIALFALLLLFRYSRPAAHDFRELLGTRFSPGVTTVLAYAILVLPLFLWLGPMWLVFYWLALFFAYATKPERIATIVLLLSAAAIPLILDRAAYRISGVDSPVVRAAVATQERAYDPETQRRLRHLVELVPDDANLRVLLGNLHVQDGDEQQAALHYRRAIEINDAHAGAHLNIGNLHFYNNDFVAATTEYERAAAIDPRMAIAFYNQSVANGEQYNFDVQGQKLEEAKKVDRGLVDRILARPPAQKVVTYNLPIAEAWELSRRVAQNRASREVFGNYATFDPVMSLQSPATTGALLALVAAIVLFLRRRRRGMAGACIKCGRTFCPRCKSSRESAIYCTQCIHIYLKRDGVSMDTKRAKLQEVQEYQSSALRRRKVFSLFFPGAGQLLDGATVRGLIGLLLFLLAVTIAVLIGRMAPVAFPAETMRLVTQILAVIVAVILWFIFALPVFRQRFSA